ncbi:Cytochrome P450 86A2 [Phytophthora cinnamomi]|uniref:Cytochrome P450 86A2 n=1 Tax=Phytophthora cinnamomi TaxID=4785 RepID=UPI00355AB0F6|nr:Cytochrome P450 86A2 [Phytophthora cinnamomi]
MSFELFDDSAVVEAALHFVDEYVEGTDDEAAFTLALDGLPSSDELQVALDPQTTSKQQSKDSTKTSSKSTVSKPKRPPTYNPNRAREQQRKELQYLRQVVMELEQEIKVLQSTRRPKPFGELEGDNGGEGDTGEVGEVSASSGFRAPDVWKEMANHQLQQRFKSEQENRRLKAVLEGQIKIGKSLAKLVEATSTTQPIESCLYGPQRTRRSDGVYMEMSANKVLPFDVASTGTATWQYFAKSMEHMPFRCFYQTDPQNPEAMDDTIVESFGLELHVKRMRANFRVKQILRRYVEEDRVVIVWRSFIDPFELSGTPLRGAEFLEKGYIVVRRPRSMAENFALLQTCYLVHPKTPVLSLSEVGTITSALTDFKLSRTAANIAARHQMIENTLFDETTRRPGAECLMLEGSGW